LLKYRLSSSMGRIAWEESKSHKITRGCRFIKLRELAQYSSLAIL